MNPDKANTTQERETETSSTDTLQGGDKVRKQDGMDQNEANRGSGQGQNRQGDNRSDQNESDRNDQRNDEGNKGESGESR